MKMKFIAVLLFCSISFLFGCSSRVRVNIPTENSGTKNEKRKSHGKVIAEAYLYDVTIKRRGKPTSFRLELFKTDSIIGLSGRAYLGKGALKGWIREDSIKIYFPSTNEFIYDATEHLLKSKNCLNPEDRSIIFSLFSVLPEELLSGYDIKLEQEDSKKVKKYKLEFPDCSVRINLRYKFYTDRWRISKFDINDGKNFKLKADLRKNKFKRRVKVPLSKFDLVIPENALRIIL